MNKIFLALIFFLSVITPIHAENLYHNINIDKIYESNDWKNKEDIKKIIDDYTLLLKYQDEFNHCPDTLPENLNCFDKIAKEIMTTLYVSPKINLEQYNRLKATLSEAYGIKNCRNKYAWPSGNLCETENDANVAVFLSKFTQDLINKSNETMLTYLPILTEYK